MKTDVPRLVPLIAEKKFQKNKVECWKLKFYFLTKYTVQNWDTKHTIAQ